MPIVDRFSTKRQLIDMTGILNKKIFFYAALVAAIFATIFVCAPAWASNPVCTPYQAVKCSVCNSSGTAWTNDDSKCAAGQVCQNWGCAASASQIKSSFDDANCSVLDGWICDPNNTGSQFGVDFYLDDTTADGYLGSASANLNRADIAGQCGGSTTHGFLFTMPANTSDGSRVVNDGKTHVIHAVGKMAPGDWYILTQSPKTLSCNGSCVPNCSARSCGADGCGGSCGSCSSGQICGSNGVCATVNRCASHSAKKCANSDLYWYDSCGEREERAQACAGTSPSLRCAGNLLEREAGDCVSGVCVSDSWTLVQDCSKTNQVCQGSACVAGNSAPPTISGLGPSGTVYLQSVALTATTNVPADCKYDPADKSFAAMGAQFNSSDKLYHSASLVLNRYGSYTYYVRCQAGTSADQASVVISFTYATAVVTVTPPPVIPKDTTSPVVSDPQPSGSVSAAAVTLAVATDERANCKYDIADTDYDSLENKMDRSANAKSHYKKITLASPGAYTYYVRCQDGSGNQDSASTPISFTYAAPQVPGPVISGLAPSGTVYQSAVALAATTDKAAACRYSATDQSYDSMEGQFATPDGQQQQATVNLKDYGSYTYYVRCADSSGNPDSASQAISFEYKDPNPQPDEAAPDAALTAPVCTEYKYNNKDGTCDNTTDCACDPDCPASPDPGADPDCAQAAPVAKKNNLVLYVALAGVLLAGAIVVLAVMARRRGEDGEEE